MKEKIQELLSNLQDFVDGRLDIEYSINDHANEFEFMRDCLNQLEIMELKKQKEIYYYF